MFVLKETITNIVFWQIDANLEGENVRLPTSDVVDNHLKMFKKRRGVKQTERNNKGETVKKKMKSKVKKCF